jgi:NTP pyrophosphatase (non-canonical NTP hydrolase)
MDFKEYEEKSRRTSNTWASLDRIENGLLGLSGESGELIDLFKKHKFQGHSLSREELALELGDVLWYVREVCDGIGFSMEEVASMNIEKLKRRFPNGFEKSRSINRED